MTLCGSADNPSPWAHEAEAVLDKDAAEHISPLPAPLASDLSGLFYCGCIQDDAIQADSEYVWRKAAVEFRIDGLDDDVYWNPDDHQITFTSNRRVRDFGAYPVTGEARGRVPRNGLDDDVDGGARDTFMVWEGQSTSGAPETRNRLVLSDARHPDAHAEPMWSATPTAKPRAAIGRVYLPIPIHP